MWSKGAQFGLRYLNSPEIFGDRPLVQLPGHVQRQIMLPQVRLCRQLEYIERNWTDATHDLVRQKKEEHSWARLQSHGRPPDARRNSRFPIHRRSAISKARGDRRVGLRIGPAEYNFRGELMWGPHQEGRS